MSSSSEDELSHFKPSGNLYVKVKTAPPATNSTNSTDLKYFECEDSTRPTETTSFQLFIFKGKESLDKILLDRRSFYRLGRDQQINQIHLQHDSISSQHAILQYRQRNGQTRLYLMDLDSKNGTKLNGSVVEGRRFYEILDGDVVNFADSTRDYVFIKKIK